MNSKDNNMSTDLDKVPDDCLRFLTTDEVIKAYNERAKKAEWVLSPIIMRAMYYERTMEYNERLKFLLKDCKIALQLSDNAYDKEELLERIGKMLEGDD